MTARASVPGLEGLVKRGAPEGVIDAPAPEDAARRRAERIRSLVVVVADNLTMVRDLVQQAKAAEDHVALGYPSWTAYVADMFGDEPLHLAREVRQELVAELSSQGMSTRAIAPIVGVSHVQVARDIDAGVTHVTPEPQADAEETAELLEPPTDLPVPSVIAGLDGKRYERPAVKPTPRVDEAKHSKAIERGVAGAENAIAEAAALDAVPGDLTDEDLESWERRLTVALAGVRWLSERKSEEAS